MSAKRSKEDFIEIEEENIALKSLTSLLLDTSLVSLSSQKKVELFNQIIDIYPIDEMVDEWFIIYIHLYNKDRLNRKLGKSSFNLNITVLEKSMDALITHSVYSKNIQSQKILAKLMIVNEKVESNISNITYYLSQSVKNCIKQCGLLTPQESDIVDLLFILKEERKSQLMSDTVTSANMLLQGSTSFFNGKLYKGTTDFEMCLSDALDKLRGENNETYNGVIVPDSYDKGVDILSTLAKGLEPLFKHKIPFINRTGILKGQIVVLAAQSNVGKTTMCIYYAVQALLNNKGVCFIATGDTDINIIYAKILVQYIYQKFGICLSMLELASKTYNKDFESKVNTAIALLAAENLTILSNSSYKTLYDDMMFYKQENDFDVLFIDHSLNLISGRETSNDSDRIKSLTETLRRLKFDAKLHIVVASHLSEDARNEIELTGNTTITAPTRGSKILGHDSDEVFVMFRTPNVVISDITVSLTLTHVKTRSTSLLDNTCTLIMDGTICDFVQEEQLLLTPDKILFDEESDEDDDDEFDDFDVDDDDY